MCRVYLIPTGKTVWEQQQRLESAIGSPLAEPSVQELHRVAGLLADQQIQALYCGDAQSEQQSADVLAGHLRLRKRVEPDLHEMDYGLWQGLTLTDIRERQPKLYRAWMEQPCSIQPPGGENVQQAADRVWSTVMDILHRHKNDGRVVMVLRPVMLALLRCRLDNIPMDGLWDVSAALEPCNVYDVNGSIKFLQFIGEPHGGA